MNKKVKKKVVKAELSVDSEEKESEENISEEYSVDEGKDPEVLHSDDPEAASSDSSRDTILYVSIAVILVIIAGFIGALKFIGEPDHPDNTFSYNGFQVTNISNQYYTHIMIPGREQSHVIEMRNSPTVAALIPMELGIKEKILSAESLYLVTDPDEESRTVIGMIEVGRIVGERFDILNIPTVVGLTSVQANQSAEADENRSIITCADSTVTDPVIYFKKGDQSMVYSEGDCIIVEGETGDDVILAADKLGYVILGIITLTQ